MLKKRELQSAIKALNELITYHAEEITFRSLPKFKIGESEFLVAMASVSTGNVSASTMFLNSLPMDFFSKDNLDNISDKPVLTHIDKFKKNNPLLSDLASVGVSVRPQANLFPPAQGTSINFIFEVKEEATILAILGKINALLLAKVAQVSTTPFAEGVLSSSETPESSKKQKLEHSIS